MMLPIAHNTDIGELLPIQPAQIDHNRYTLQNNSLALHGMAFQNPLSGLSYLLYYTLHKIASRSLYIFLIMLTLMLYFDII